MFPCPCCGYVVFAEPPGSYNVCPVCDWEDDALQLEFATSLAGGANPSTLLDAQRDFATRAARLARKRPDARYPLERDPTWRPIDPKTDRFPEWRVAEPERAPAPDASLYYWRATFWKRKVAT
jgi:hypothetical protein